MRDGILFWEYRYYTSIKYKGRMGVKWIIQIIKF